MLAWPKHLVEGQSSNVDDLFSICDMKGETPLLLLSGGIRLKTCGLLGQIIVNLLKLTGLSIGVKMITIILSVLVNLISVSICVLKCFSLFKNIFVLVPREILIF